MLTINFEKTHLFGTIGQDWLRCQWSSISFVPWAEKYLIDKFDEMRHVKLYIDIESGNWWIDASFVSPEA